jgi:hypothetical protein
MTRGYCPRCEEYRSDNGLDAWKIIWRDDRPTCERCGSYVDVWNITNENIKKIISEYAAFSSIKTHSQLSSSIVIGSFLDSSQSNLTRSPKISTILKEKNSTTS